MSLESPPITDYDSLLAALAALPPTSRGYVRVYRGQSRHYPKMLASGRRGKALPFRKVWTFYTREIAGRLGLGPMQAEISVAELQVHQIWLAAVAQHYGAGSDFLDVTTDLDMALWFALHTADRAEQTGLIGPDGPPDPERDHAVHYDAVHYSEHDGPAYLYVFDVPRWDGRDLAEHLVDLAAAPDPFRRSKRMQVQSACLLAAAHDGDGDLMSCCVGKAPLVVGRPLAGARGLARRTAEIFPAAMLDPWYARFLGLPYVFAPTGEPGQVALRRPLPITVYFDFDLRSEGYLSDLVGRGIAVNPLFVHTWLGDMQLGKPPGLGRQWWEDHPFRQATPVVLDCPFLGVTPPVDKDLWNIGLLTGDLSDNGYAYDFAFDRPLPPRSLPQRDL